MSEEYEIISIPLHVRKRKAALAALATIGFSAWTLWQIISYDYFGWSTLGLVPFMVAGSWVSYRYWTMTETRQIKTAILPARKQNPNLSPTDKIWMYGINTFGVLLVLSSFGIFGLQVFSYLKTGEWTALPLKVLVAFSPNEFQSWVANPCDWVGVHKLVNGILELAPLSLCALAAGIWMVGYEIKSKS